MHRDAWDDHRSVLDVELAVFRLVRLDNARKYVKLEDAPRSTPGHSKVLEQIRAIMKLMYSRFNKKVA